VLDTAYMIHKLADTGKKLKLKFVPMAEVFGKYRDIMRRIPDLSKAKRLLNYAPQVRTSDAISRTIAEVRKKLKDNS
jgi:nucleoside-diphosphate-sugar epimerase